MRDSALKFEFLSEHSHCQSISYSINQSIRAPQTTKGLPLARKAPTLTKNLLIKRQMPANQLNATLDSYHLTGFLVVDNYVELFLNKAEEAFPINIVKEQIV